MGNSNSLYKESPSATDVRYDPDASDNLIDQSPIWDDYAGMYSALNYTYIADTNDEGTYHVCVCVCVCVLGRVI